MRFFNTKQSTQIRLDQLVDSVTQLMRDLEGLEELPASIARQHVEAADKNCGAAIKQFADQRFDVCISLIEKAELHLHMAQVALKANEDDRLELQFASNTAAGTMLDLSNAIADLKYSVEYTNASMPAEHKQSLLTVMDLWWEACEAFLNYHDATAQRLAEVGLLLLNILVLNINLDNDRGDSQVMIRKTFSNPLLTNMRRFAESLSESYHLVSGTDAAAAKARDHLTNAIKSLNDAMSHLLSGDDKAADATVAAGLLDLKYVQRLVVQGDAKGEPVSRPKSNPIDIKKVRREFAEKLSLHDTAATRSDRHGAGARRNATNLAVDPIIEIYNRIVDLVIDAKLDAKKQMETMADLQSVVRFIRLAKKQYSDRKFASELCDQALDDLTAARVIILGAPFGNV